MCWILLLWGLPEANLGAISKRCKKGRGRCREPPGNGGDQSGGDESHEQTVVRNGEDCDGLAISSRIGEEEARRGELRRPQFVQYESPWTRMYIETACTSGRHT